VQHAVTRQTALRSFGPMADCAKGRLNRVAGPNALPVLSRKVIEGHQFFPVFLQADGVLRVLWLIGLEELELMHPSSIAIIVQHFVTSAIVFLGIC